MVITDELSLPSSSDILQDIDKLLVMLSPDL